MFFAPKVPEISVTELHDRLEDPNADVLLVDIRSAQEREYSNIGGSHIPMQELPNRIGEIESDPAKEVVIYCRSGSRSASAVAWMHARGIERAFNLRGGILAWAREVDSAVKSY